MDLSFGEVAATLSTVLGRPVRAVRVTDEEAAAPLRELGLIPAQVDGRRRDAAGAAGGFVPEGPRTTASTTPTTLAAWAQAVLVPAVRTAG